MKIFITILCLLILACSKKSSENSPEEKKLRFLHVNFNYQQNLLEASNYDNDLINDPNKTFWFSIGTKKEATDVMDWVQTNEAKLYNSNLSLKHNTRYFVNLKVKSNNNTFIVISDSFKAFKPNASNWNTHELTVPHKHIANRSFHTAVWTGSEMIIWGGFLGNTIMGSGVSYNPKTNVWSDITEVNAPSARTYHTAIWTGKEMIIWGGSDANSKFNDGAAYNPTTKKWRSLSSLNAPTPRTQHMALWDQGKMIIWGGIPAEELGASYDPLTDSWSSFSFPSIKGRRLSSFIRANDKLIMWGGADENGDAIGTGKILSNNKITTMPSSNAPSARMSHSTVWTGNELIIWGGKDSRVTNTGSIYDPYRETWRAMTSVNAPVARTGHTTTWTGKEMIVWGGLNDYRADLADVYSYDPSKDQWRILSHKTTHARSFHTAVWTGLEVIVWGGSALNRQSQKISVADSYGHCGGDGSFHRDCYSDSQQASYARHLGTAVTIMGQEVVYTRNKYGVMIWKDIYTNRILGFSLWGWYTNDHEGVTVQNFNTVKGIKCEFINWREECDYVF